MAHEKPGTPSQDPAEVEGARPWTTRRKAVTGIIAALLLTTIIVVIAIVSTSRNSSDPSGSSTPSASSTISASPQPSASGTPVSSRPPGPSASATAAPIASPGTIKPGLTAQITKFEAVDGVAKTPGEVSGPSVRFTVTVTNTGATTESLDTTVVTAYFGIDRKPALELSEPGGVDMPGSVAGGGTATGIYIFSIPRDQRNDVRLEVDYSVKVAPLVFQGALPL